MSVGVRHTSPPRGTSLGELARAQPAFRRLAIVDKMYELAEQGSVKHAELLARLMGELAANVSIVAVDSPMLQAIDGMRTALGLPPLLGPAGAADAQAIEAQSTLVPDDAPTDAT